MTFTYCLSNLMETERPVGVPFFKTFLNQNLNWYVTLHMRSYVCLGIYSGEQRLTHLSPIAESMWIHFDCQNCHICLLKCLYFLWKEVLLFSVWLFKCYLVQSCPAALRRRMKPLSTSLSVSQRCLYLSEGATRRIDSHTDTSGLVEKHQPCGCKRFHYLIAILCVTPAEFLAIINVARGPPAWN